MINNLPNGWRIEELGNLKLDISDGNYSSLYPTQNEFVESGIPFIRANNIYKNTVIDKDMRFISEEKHSILKKGQLKQNDLLFTNRGIIGQVGLVPDKYIGANINAQIVRINSGNKYTNKYLMYCFLRQKLKNQMTTLQTGSTLKQLPIKQLKKLQVSIPPLQEQEKIVKVLDLTSNLIEKQKELLKNYDLFLKSKFIEMFGDPITNPKGWEVEKIGNITKLQTGKTPSRKKNEYWENGNINWAKTTEVNQFKLTYTEEFITELALKECNLISFPINTILIAMYGQGKTRGKVVITKIETTINQAFGAILPNDTFNSLYLLKVLDLMYQDIRDLARGGNQENLNMDIVKNIKIIFPPLKLQNKFASIVEKIETIKEKENQKLKQLEDLHNSMMNKAFKGEIQ